MSTENCYWPNGGYATDFTSCGATNITSHCCDKTHYCLSNQPCFGSDINFFYRGACTDKSWPTESCGDVCLEPDDRERVVVPCVADDKQFHLEYVCIADNCNNRSETFKLPPGKLQLTNAVASDVSLPPNPASLVPLGLGLGFGLGLPLLAALVGYLYFWGQRRRINQPVYQRRLQPTNQALHPWPQQSSIVTSHSTTPKHTIHDVNPTDMTAMPAHSVHTSELGDTSNSKMQDRASGGWAREPISQMGWEAMGDQERR